MNKITGFLKGISPRTWIIIAIVVILIIVIILYIRNNKPVPKVIITGAINPVPIPVATFPLMLGSRGAEVSKLQTYLNTKGETLAVDGIWGPLTQASTLKVLKVSSIDKALLDSLK